MEFLDKEARQLQRLNNFLYLTFSGASFGQLKMDGVITLQIKAVKSLRLTTMELQRFKEDYRFLKNMFVKCSYGDFQIDDGIDALGKLVATLEKNEILKDLEGE